MKTKYIDQNLLGTGRFIYISLMVVLLILFTACSKDGDEVSISLDGPVLSVSDFSGTWNATTAIFENFDGSQRLEIVAEGGSATLVVQTNGRFSLTLNISGLGSEVISGELGFNEDEYGERLIVVFDGEPREDYEVFNISLNSGVLSLSGVTTFDFTGNGTEEPATVDLVMVRT